MWSFYQETIFLVFFLWCDKLLRIRISGTQLVDYYYYYFIFFSFGWSYCLVDHYLAFHLFEWIIKDSVIEFGFGWIVFTLQVCFLWKRRKMETLPLRESIARRRSNLLRPGPVVLLPSRVGKFGTARSPFRLLDLLDPLGLRWNIYIYVICAENCWWFSLWPDIC